MKGWFRKSMFILAPFLLLIVINESARQSNEKSNHLHYGIKTINSNAPNLTFCTWQCHYNTGYCIQHHTILLKPYVNSINPIYFEIIALLKSTGNYGFANILFLVVLWPLLLFLLVKKVLENRQKINLLMNKQWK